jgi:hypothetical protein
MNMTTENETPDTGHNAVEEPNYRYNRELFYHFDREKGFSQEVSYQNSSNQVIIKQSWDVAEQRLEAVRQSVIDGKHSPIAYFMEKVLMEVPMLAAYMGIAKWRVRRHLTWRGFNKLSHEKLLKYASIFEVPVEELKEPNFLKQLSNQ